MSKQNRKNSKQTTIGLDLGDRKHTYCALSGGGEVMKEATIHNERGELTELTRQYPGATVVMEEKRGIGGLLDVMGRRSK